MTGARLQLADSSLLKSQALIDGAWVSAASGKSFPVENPADGSILSRVADLGLEEARQAILAAERARSGWSACPAKQRAQAMRRWFDLIIANGEDLARLVTAEMGKPLREARAELTYAASFIEWFAEEAKRISGEVLAAPTPNQRIVVLRQPIGVCAAITPWNFPLAMITRKAGAALAAGCTMVIKPAELTPLSALALGELAIRAEIPPGVLNIVTTHDPVEIGAEFCRNPVVRKITFTGSTEVGRILLRQSADTVKKCSMELGGNAPVIVFADCDIDTAIAGIITSKFRNAGQSCIAANRIFVADEIHDEVAARLASAAENLVVGNGAEDGVQIGPLVEPAALAKVQAHVEDAVRLGAKIRIGGQRHALGGSFFQPTVIAGATPAMRVFREETFGPVVSLFRFHTEEEAITLANDSRYGLAAYFYTQNLSRTIRVAEALEFGIIGINEGMVSTEIAPFGGIKESGLGREGSRHGIDDYLEMKYVCLGGL